MFCMTWNRKTFNTILKPMSEIKLNTKRTGWLGEQAVAKNLISEHGLDVYFPVVDDKGVDMIVDTGRNLKRVQVKTRKSKKSNTSVEVRLGQYKGSNIDVIAIYYEPKDIIAYVPYNDEEFLNLALSTAKNNQEQGRTWFYKYMEFPL